MNGTTRPVDGAARWGARRLVDALPEARAALASVRMVATDVDGTLTERGSDGSTTLLPVVLGAIEELTHAGVEVLPVTGRTAGEALALARYLPGVRRSIAENGATLLVPDAPVEVLRGERDAARLRGLPEALVGSVADPRGPLQLAPDAFARVGDVAFERGGRDELILRRWQLACEDAGVAMIWSSVHVHLSTAPPDKGAAVLELAARDGLDPATILTIGDAPNDAGLWTDGRFGWTVGNADIDAWASTVLDTTPSFVLPRWRVAAGAQGWCEMAEVLLSARA